jgi:iron complex transport system substrate-binding protein
VFEGPAVINEEGAMNSSVIVMDPPLTDADVRALLDEITRREFIVGAAALSSLLVACGSDDSAAPAASTSSGPWSMVDDRGIEITLPQRPERVVAYVGNAAVLWDFGVRAVGVFGPQRRKDGTPEPAAGNVDLDAVESAGDTWEGVNLEALAAIRPDLVVTGIASGAMWVINDKQADEVDQIAPIFAIEVYDKPATQILARYQELATALGADPSSPELQQARKDFDAATDDLRAAIESKPGLLTMFTYADSSGLYIAKVKDFPDLLDFADLGLDIVEAGGPDNYYELLSWEQADRYPADLILADERSYSLQPDQLAADYPTWNQLPAVQAGQVGGWNVETVLSYQGFGAAISRLADDVRSADTTVVP